MRSVIEFITVSRTASLKVITIQKCIELCVGELTRLSEHVPQIQQPAQEILVAIGRKYCNQVMECLIKQLHSNQVPHFMIFYCLGTLSTANVNGTINFIKPILAVIIPTLALIKTDHVKQAYSFGEFKRLFLIKKGKQNFHSYYLRVFVYLFFVINIPSTLISVYR